MTIRFNRPSCRPEHILRRSKTEAPILFNLPNFISRQSQAVPQRSSSAQLEPAFLPRGVAFYLVLRQDLSDNRLIPALADLI